LVSLFFNAVYFLIDIIQEALHPFDLRM